MPTGSAVFETVSEQEYRGVVHSPVQHFSAAASTSGVIAFQEGDSSAKILFGEHDFKVQMTPCLVAAARKLCLLHYTAFVS